MRVEHSGAFGNALDGFVDAKKKFEKNEKCDFSGKMTVVFHDFTFQEAILQCECFSGIQMFCTAFGIFDSISGLSLQKGFPRHTRSNEG